MDVFFLFIGRWAFNWGGGGHIFKTRGVKSGSLRRYKMISVCKNLKGVGIFGHPWGARRIFSSTGRRMGFSAVSERLSRYPQLLYFNIFLFQGCLKAVKAAVLMTSMSQMIFFLIRRVRILRKMVSRGNSLISPFT